MVCKAVRHDDLEGRVGESFNHVSGFEVILAVSVRGEPPRGQIVDVMPSLTTNGTFCGGREKWIGGDGAVVS
jgi:hypothetical protein